ncbi:glycosyltransferase family protein [Rhizobium oryziradicis]|uniref:Glycosyl transferase n=1 Tax=Rhizobium oryziradicis TaxID=1867956 RepID=A0A1Q8ZWP1_9HYPH|nr:glycosyltransferase [Rhizobium oryziradicis]OLP46505.1 glycosyl transferase [Rhizobium oryziradicis]
MTQPAPKRVMFYVQHLLGIGHLARASRIAGAMVEVGFAVTLVTGGAPVKGFPGEGIAHAQLPAVLSATGFSGLVDSDGAAVDAAFEQNRTALLLETFERMKPDVVIVEAFPFGRRQVRFELLPLLAAIKAAEHKPLLFSSVRDILQENRKPGRDQETVDLVLEHFDGVLVHGDPHFVRLEETFPLAETIADKIYYTGLVAAPEPAPAQDPFDIVVSAGGGAVGAALIEAAMSAQQILGGDDRWCLITGPNLPQADYDRFADVAPQNVTLYRFRPDFPALLPRAKLSISQAGYNTVCDLLRARCPALLVPFAAGGETEQTVRAQKLQALGLAHVILEEGLNGAAMAEAVARAKALQFPEDLTVSLNGAAETARLVAEKLDQRANG